MKENSLNRHGRPSLHVSLLILVLLSSSLFALVLGEPKSAALPPGAPMSATPTAWGGAGKNNAGGGPSAPYISTAYKSNMTLTATAPTGSLILVFAEGGWQSGPADLQPTDNAGSGYGKVFNVMFHYTAGSFFYTNYFGVYQVWVARTVSPVTLVQVPHTGGNETFLETFAIAYVNASSVGASGFVNASAGSTHYLVLQTTAANATIAYAGWTVRTSLDVACPQVGSSNGKNNGLTSNFTQIYSNTSVGVTAPYGYHDRCDANLLGMRGFSAGPINQVGKFTYTARLTQYQPGASFFAVAEEIIPKTVPYPTPSPWVNPTGPAAPGFYDWIPPLVFLTAGGLCFGMLGLAAWQFIKDLRE